MSVNCEKFLISWECAKTVLTDLLWSGVPEDRGPRAARPHRRPSCDPSTRQVSLCLCYIFGTVCLVSPLSVGGLRGQGAQGRPSSQHPLAGMSHKTIFLAWILFCLFGILTCATQRASAAMDSASSHRGHERLGSQRYLWTRSHGETCRSKSSGQAQTGSG